MSASLAAPRIPRAKAVSNAPVLRRYAGNPVLTPAQMPCECSAVFNAGATWFEDEVLLLLRVEDRSRQTRFHVATSRDGINFTVRPEPINYPMRELEVKHGGHRFDMRITPMDGAYYIFHAVWLGKLGCSIATTRTTDFVNFDAMPSLSVPSNRNAVLFPDKIGGLYARLERPQNIDGTGQIWVSYSPDLVFWGKSAPLNMPGTAWSTQKSGAGCVPIRTPAGWLEIYHATAMTASTENYYLGAMLLDLEDPSKVIAAPDRFVLAAEEVYECVGQVPNVVFTGGAVEMPDGTLNIYYGGADTRMCIAQTTVEQLVEFCLQKSAQKIV